MHQNNIIIFIKVVADFFSKLANCNLPIWVKKVGRHFYKFRSNSLPPNIDSICCSFQAKTQAECLPRVPMDNNLTDLIAELAMNGNFELHTSDLRYLHEFI